VQGRIGGITAAILAPQPDQGPEPFRYALRQRTRLPVQTESVNSYNAGICRALARFLPRLFALLLALLLARLFALFPATS
jgi:hypothetical protein